MENKWLLFLTLMFLFGFKAFWPLYPLSLVCAATGVVFPFYIAIPVNIAGMILHYTLKYIWGKRMGPGGVNLILKKNETLSRFIKMNDTGNPWLLVILRFIPFIPVNPVSQLYGSMGFNYGKFILLSLAGYMPLLCSYTLVGRNATNPLSAGFLIPLIVLAFAGSAVAYTISIILNYQKYRSEKNGSDKNT
ncbi:MAG: TVP38/TMEM64 family protein [Clostridia bacterium]|nr:TVP38/TMEM64 family protein [Clostridia bacterium]